MLADPEAATAPSAPSQTSPTGPPGERASLRHVREAVRAELFGGKSAPRTIGRYEVRRKLGEGGMGTVYLAVDPMLRRKVAIKVMRAETAPVNMKRLRREAKAMATAWHPNVVKVFAVEREGERLAIVMEYVPGASLDGWLRRRARPPHRVLDVFRQAAIGLRAAHALGIVHRDFKPGNVLVDRAGRAKVADFGLATAAAMDSIELDMQSHNPTASLTLAGTVVGTPAYMAPEQHLGVDVDAKADVFAFSVALVEALTGKRPFRAPTLVDLFAVKKRGAKVALGLGREFRPLERVIEAGLSYLSEERPSVDRFIEVLRAPPRRPSPMHWIKLGALALVVGSAGHSVVGPSQDDAASTSASAEPHLD
ncbi:MAG: serine/threonine-protein kinase [Myxococcota bacterium]